MTAALAFPEEMHGSIDELELARSVCRESFYEFVKDAWSSVESAPFIDNWHIGAICEHLQAVTEGQIARLLINVPPWLL